MTSSNGNIFRVTGHLCGEFTGPWWNPHTGQSRGALVFSLICVWIKGWVNNRDAGDLRRYRAHYDVIVMGKKKAIVDTSDIAWSRHHSTIAQWFRLFFSQWLQSYEDITSLGDQYILSSSMIETLYWLVKRWLIENNTVRAVQFWNLKASH